MSDVTRGMILLCGSPRSGTTWLGKIFDSHPDTLYRHEPDSALYPDDVPLYLPLSAIEDARAPVTRYINNLLQLRTSRISGKLPLFPKSYYSPVAFHLRRALILGAKAGEAYFGQRNIPDLVDHARRPDVRLVWKSVEPGRLGVFVHLLDDCRTVFIVRHPCGYVASIVRGESVGGFVGGTASEDYGILEMLLATEPARARGLTMSAMRSLTPVERLAWRWVLTNEKVMAEIEGHPGCRVIRYEDLCAEPETVARELFRFTGLSWHPQSEAFIGQSTSHQNESFHSVFKNPQHSAGKWKDELGADDIERISAVARDSTPGRLFLTAAATGS